MPKSPGARLGSYEILIPLGAGGMGEVYKAKDNRLDRTVAIKVLPSHLADKPQLRERFEHEGRTALAPVVAPEVVEKIPNIDHRYGNRDAEILGIAVLNENGEELALLPQKAGIIVRLSLRAHAEVSMPIVGVLIRNHLGVELAGSNTALEETDLPALNPGDVYTIDFHFQLSELYPAHFSFTPAISNGTLEDYQVCDWIDNAVTLQAEKGRKIYGYFHFPCRIAVNAVTKGRIQAGGSLP
ncbi:MAG: Wzt carbohydrate-binding domain-containing protein [Acidobacteria bacterium]|nr:Wzt carbohydrate-binding domain-containing protein [Acidobacteriota bacterium]